MVQHDSLANFYTTRYRMKEKVVPNLKIMWYNSFVNLKGGYRESDVLATYSHHDLIIIHDQDAVGGSEYVREGVEWKNQRWCMAG